MNEDVQIDADEPNQEYETQYFGFTPSTAVDEVFNINSDFVEDAIRITNKVLTVKYPDISPTIIQKASEDLYDDILKSLDKMCDKLELYLLNNILNMPDNFVLPEDRVHQDNSLKTVDETKLDNDIKELKQMINDKVKSIVELRSEKERLDLLIKSYEQTLDTIGEMEKVLSDAEVGNLYDVVTASASKASELLEVMQSLESTDC